LTTPQQLLARLDAIGHSLSKRDTALALLGLGSVGTETARLDAYSDLDFFVIVREGAKQSYLANLDWLAEPNPIAYSFMNTEDGYKALYEDGIFCEFAVFEPRELANIPFTAGRIVWATADFDTALAAPAVDTTSHRPKLIAWRLGEALTNLYVGLGRYHRGEKLTASRFIQHYAVDQILNMASEIEQAKPALIDPFGVERRFEQRFPDVAARLPSFIQGYDRSRESALAILAFLEAHFEVNAAIAARIRELAHR